MWKPSNAFNNMVEAYAGEFHLTVWDYGNYGSRGVGDAPKFAGKAVIGTSTVVYVTDFDTCEECTKYVEKCLLEVLSNAAMKMGFQIVDIARNDKERID